MNLHPRPLRPLSTEHAAHQISLLAPTEKVDLIQATCSYWRGGDPLLGSLREKAIKLGLVYAGTGRLRPVVYEVLLS